MSCAFLALVNELSDRTNEKAKHAVRSTRERISSRGNSLSPPMPSTDVPQPIPKPDIHGPCMTKGVPLTPLEWILQHTTNESKSASPARDNHASQL